MKAVIFVSSLAAAVLIAAGAPAVSDDPIEDDKTVFVSAQEPQYRYRRSQYGPPPPQYGPPLPSPPPYGLPSPPAYAAPCSAPAPLPYLPPLPHPSYGFGGGHSVSYAPHYRSDDFMDTDLLNFPDLEISRSEHMPMARYGYGIPAASVASAHAGSASTTGYSGIGSYGAAASPAFSVFPNAHVGGCNVPLLLSCSPSVTPGRLIKSYGEAPSVASSSSSSSTVVAGANGYRGVDDQQPLEGHNEHLEEQPAHTKFESTKDSIHSTNNN